MAVPSDVIIKTLTSDILKERPNPTLNEGFIEFYLKLLWLNPKYTRVFSKDMSYNGEFIKFAVNDLINEKGPMCVMLHMQYDFEKNYDTPDNLIVKNQNNIDKHTEPLLSEILQARPNSKEEFEKVLRRISIFIVLKSGLGDPSNIQVLREGTAALNSVFTMDDLRSFNQQKQQCKEKQLNELLSIVSGIRIFNKDCGKGGEGIPDLTNNLSEAAEATNLALSHTLIKIMERVNLLTTAIDTHITIDPETKHIKLTHPIDKNVTDDEYNHTCKILSVYRQYEILVRKLIADMEYIQVENKELCVNFSTYLYDLHSLVRYRTAIPADQVFNNMFLISAINNVMWNLDGTHEKMDVPHSLIDNLLNKRRVLTDAERMIQTNDCKFEQIATKCQVVFITDKIIDDIIYQYLGFCGMCICAGALIPANPKMGLLKWGERHFAFCTLEHGKIFGANPNRFIRETWEYVRNNIEMINFLQIYDEINSIRHINNLGMKHMDTVKTKDKEVQTELHPIPTYIDKNYIWNIWDYKKKICKMADIIKCKTHSTQTHETPSKIEAASQTESFKRRCIILPNVN